MVDSCRLPPSTLVPLCNAGEKEGNELMWDKELADKEAKGPLTVDEYVKEAGALHDRWWLAWQDLARRVEFTTVQDAIRVSYTKWTWISSQRRTMCAFCEYQGTLEQEQRCQGCPVKEACHNRNDLTAMQIEQLLDDMLYKEEVPF